MQVGVHQPLLLLSYNGVSGRALHITTPKAFSFFAMAADYAPLGVYRNSLKALWTDMKPENTDSF